MSSRGIDPRVLRDYIGLFVDERAHFYARRLSQAVFLHEDRWLTHTDIQHHLEGRWWVAVTAAGCDDASP